MNTNNPSIMTTQLGLEGLESVASGDQVPLVSTLSALFVGFDTRNADLLESVYTDDANWVNAFGSVKVGSKEIVEYLRGLFADKNFNNGTHATPPRSMLRKLSDDIVVVSTHLQIKG